MSSIYVTRGQTRHQQEREAVTDLHTQLAMDELAFVVCFASAHYDQTELSKALNDSFPCPVVACTTAGEIGEAYGNDGITGIGFSASQFEMRTTTLRGLAGLDSVAIQESLADLLRDIESTASFKEGAKVFGFLLIDGLSTMEERITAEVHRALGGVPLIGGSAGDSLQFRETRVFTKREGFVSDAASITLIASKLPFEIFKLQHFVPSEIDMVVTESNSRERIISEIDGAPAAVEYARLVGLDENELTPMVFSQYPVMIEIGDEWYVRSIQKVNEDGSLTFYCAIDDGLVLTVAKGVDFVATLREQVENLESQFDKIHVTLGFDCILRRLEMIEKQLTSEVETLTRRIQMTGFSTFGEQINAIHVNQTLTGVCIGERPE